MSFENDIVESNKTQTGGESVTKNAFIKIKTKLTPTKSTRLFFIFYVCACAFFCALEWIMRDGDGIVYSLYLIVYAPLLWAVILRPIFIKRLYLGNYIITDVIWFTPNVIFETYKAYGRTDIAFEKWLPIITAAGAMIVFAALFFNKKRRKNAFFYLVAFSVVSDVWFLFVFFRGLHPALSLSALAVSLLGVFAHNILEPGDFKTKMGAAWK